MIRMRLQQKTSDLDQQPHYHTYLQRGREHRSYDPGCIGSGSSYALLIVDDGSPDGTADAVRGLMKQYPDRLHLLERPGKQGLGTAYILGFRWALEEGILFVLEMDADFSHDPKDLPRLIKACSEGADVSAGSRYEGRKSRKLAGRPCPDIQRCQHLCAIDHLDARS